MEHNFKMSKEAKETEREVYAYHMNSIERVIKAKSKSIKSLFGVSWFLTMSFVTYMLAQDLMQYYEWLDYLVRAVLYILAIVFLVCSFEPAFKCSDEIIGFSGMRSKIDELVRRVLM